MLVPLTPRQTTDMAAAALSSGRGAGLPELLELVQTLASKMERISIAELAELIEQDPVVATRLVSMANLIALNPGMKQLTGVPHAIHQIGFQRVRGLAMSLLLLKSSGERQNPPEQRQAASRALCAGLIAQACARQISAVDPDMVFACATLRQIGRIVLPVVSLEHYKAAVAAAGTKSEDAAFRQFFGLAPLELSRELLKTYALPAEIRHALVEFHPGGSDDAAPSSHAERLTGLAEYGNRLTRIVLDVTLDDSAYAAETTQLAKTFGAILPNVSELLVQTLDFAGERLAQFMQVPGVSSAPEVMLRRIRSRLPKPETVVQAPAPLETAGEPVAASALSAAPTVTASTTPFPEVAVAPRPPATSSEVSTAPPREVLPEAITLVPEPVRTVTPDEPWLEVLRPVRDGFAADDCAVFLRAAPDGPFILADGVGAFATHHLDIASVHPAEKTVFSIALARREAVVIHDSRTATILPYLPAWFQGDTHTPAAFVLVPLPAGDQVGGLVLIGWSHARRIELTPGHEALLNLLRTSAQRLITATKPSAVIARTA
ncbi:HDOD domain-containing protein [Oleiharenicola lentus]|uniref:HDOD domain-containing protein n=1 Tax=Oleiharenicola lentus TaxID=2508720 RepID=A0A4Q1C406_9BACT|nr:HDOD domain-containing protein [Oleiharenicola lentus]RXK53102.1 HDOD domain-containing protein [Oleiharenicola lentus]